MLHLVYGTNSPLIFESLVRYSLLHFYLSHMAVHHLYNLYYHHLHFLLLVHSELNTWLIGKSFPPWTFSSPTDWFHEMSDYLTLLFCSTDAWCVRLRRLLVDFRTHLKSMHFRSFISLRCSRSKQPLREIIAAICAWTIAPCLQYLLYICQQMSVSDTKSICV